MTTYYKAVRPDLTDFRTGTIHYNPGATITHPNPHRDDASGYLSVATVPTDCTGSEWPLRLVEVTADEVWTDRQYPNKRCTHSLRVVREIDAHLAFGPQGREVAALIERCASLTYEQARELAAAGDAARDAAGDAAWAAAWDAARAAARDAAWDAARAAAWDAARDAAWDAARAAARDAARDAARAAARAAARDAARAAAWDAARALINRDLIGDTFIQAHYDTLTEPWRTAIGPIHPDDPDLHEGVTG